MAACLGVSLDVIEPCGFPLSDKSLRRAAMDYGAAADVTRHDSWAAFLAHRAKGRLVLFTTRAAKPLYGFDFQDDDTLLFGRESSGVPDEVHATVEARVLIPIRPETRSLNLVSACAMGLGEAMRQLGGAPSDS